MITNEILKNIKHVHFIGIGGSGMYPLVQIFHSKGYFITGSDNNETETLEAVLKTNEVCDRPLETFGAHPCFWAFIAA